MVVALESDPELCSEAQRNLSELDITNAAVVTGDFATGAPEEGPFDLIFIGAAIEREPDALLRQLKDGGRLAAIRRRDGVSRGVVYTCSDGAIGFRTVFDATTAAILPGFELERGFAF
jgi:protein-L-isoaspartate(D-aspartate) O-methyltransferase